MIYLKQVFRKLPALEIGCLLLIILVPISYLIFDHEWIYPNLDSAHSLSGISLSLNYTSEVFPKHHYLAGLIPWLIPLYHLVNIVGIHLVVPVVQVGSWIIISLLIFFLARNLFGRRSAMVVLPWIIFFPFITGEAAGGGVSANFAATIYGLTSLLFWVHGTKTEKKWLFELSGYFFISCLHTRILYLPLFVLFPLISFYLKGSSTKSQFRLFFIGCLSGSLIWSFINVLYGRSFFFYYLPYYLDLKNLARLVFNDEVKNFYELTKKYIWGYFALWLIGLIKILLSWKKEAIQRQVFTYSFIGLFLLWGIWQLIGGYGFFPHRYMYVLQIPMFLMLASWFEDRPVLGRELVYFLLGSLFLWVSVFYSSEIGTAFDHSNTLAGILLILTLFFIFLISATTFSHVPYFLILILLYGFFTPLPKKPYLDCSYRKDFYNAYADIAEDLQKYQPNSNLIAHYMNDKKVVSRKECFIGVDSMQIAMASLFNMVGKDVIQFSYPNKPLSEWKDYELRISEGTLLVLYPFDSQTFSHEVVERLYSLGFVFEKVGNGRTFPGEIEIPYDIYALKGFRDIEN